MYVQILYFNMPQWKHCHHLINTLLFSLWYNWKYVHLYINLKNTLTGSNITWISRINFISVSLMNICFGDIFKELSDFNSLKLISFHEFLLMSWFRNFNSIGCVTLKSHFYMDHMLRTLIFCTLLKNVDIKFSAYGAFLK